MEQKVTVPPCSTFQTYSSSGADTGQTPAHVPHEIHADCSISNLESPCDIHPTGHSAAHAPQEIHASDIL